ncbi:MAG: hypothetical protein H0V34_11325 [Gammaproteobacteria bacterium]|nr:hypothetical protein [Gammaproteobacteria bacterium]
MLADASFKAQVTVRDQKDRHSAVRDILSAGLQTHALEQAAQHTPSPNTTSVAYRADRVRTYNLWKHLRTSNAIESVFTTVRLRQRITKDADTRAKSKTMAFKLIGMAVARWRKLDAAHLLPLVRAGMQFGDGVPLECHANEAGWKDAA